MCMQICQAVQRLQLCTMAALLIFLSALLPLVRANFVTVTGSVFCDVDNSKYVNFPPDQQVRRTAKVKIVCIIGPNATTVRYKRTDALGNYIFNASIPNMNSTKGRFKGCIASIVSTLDKRCNMVGPCNNGDIGTAINNSTGGIYLYYNNSYKLPPFCFVQPRPCISLDTSECILATDCTLCYPSGASCICYDNFCGYQTNISRCSLAPDCSNCVPNSDRSGCACCGDNCTYPRPCESLDGSECSLATDCKMCYPSGRSCMCYDNFCFSQTNISRCSLAPDCSNCVPNSDRSGCACCGDNCPYPRPCESLDGSECSLATDCTNCVQNYPYACICRDNFCGYQTNISRCSLAPDCSNCVPNSDRSRCVCCGDNCYDNDISCCSSATNCKNCVPDTDPDPEGD